MKIAISGKGGVGKTTLAGTLARLFARDGYNVLAIDADPSMNLGSAIGISQLPKPVIEHKDLIQERAGMPMGMFKMNPKVDDITQMCGCTGPDNVKLVVMGTIDSGGSGCMCPANAFVKALIRHVITREKDLVIMDMEAGIEHLGRATARGVDAMIAVVEPGMRSIETVERIMQLGKQIGITRYLAVINKSSEPGVVEERLKGMGIEVIGVIPYDKNLIEADLSGKAPVDVGGPAVEEMKKIKQRLQDMFEKDAVRAA
ncbi:MAG: protochlorophyllide reductase iron-sulfur ATP-binding protein [Methanosaeta sp. PtaU1.Bin060]|jgi:CO dehydrogenase maturation factor|nr:MAG: protochlorophyllide reductase iron-sulfur ATP-binding protein [Methanosaeta sp. PtaU1.Bin060]